MAHEDVDKQRPTKRRRVQGMLDEMDPLIKKHLFPDSIFQVWKYFATKRVFGTAGSVNFPRCVLPSGSIFITLLPLSSFFLLFLCHANSERVSMCPLLQSNRIKELILRKQ